MVSLLQLPKMMHRFPRWRADATIKVNMTVLPLPVGAHRMMCLLPSAILVQLALKLQHGLDDLFLGVVVRAEQEHAQLDALMHLEIVARIEELLRPLDPPHRRAVRHAERLGLDVFLFRNLLVVIDRHRDGKPMPDAEAVVVRPRPEADGIHPVIVATVVYLDGPRHVAGVDRAVVGQGLNQAVAGSLA